MEKVKKTKSGGKVDISREGIFAVWKPKGPTSFDVVARVRRFFGIKKVGHAGTLDPLAEGVLVIAVGRENTKKIDEFRQQEKEYVATIKLGQESSTDDEEGEKKDFQVEEIPSRKSVAKALGNFVGHIRQTTPRYSAVKIRGKEAYKRARRGEVFSLPKRDVEIKQIELLDYSWPFLKARVVTGSGVYIRSLAREVGDLLGCGGYLAELTRSRVGDFTKKNSWSWSFFEIKTKSETKG